MSFGIAMGMCAIAYPWKYHFEFIDWVGASGFIIGGCVAYFPTLAQPYLQNYFFKIFARTLLGFGIVMMWFGAILMLPLTLSGLLLRFVFVVVFIATARATLWQRAALAINAEESCPNGGFPCCKIADQLRRENNFDVEIKILEAEELLTPTNQAGD